MRAPALKVPALSLFDIYYPCRYVIISAVLDRTFDDLPRHPFRVVQPFIRVTQKVKEPRTVLKAACDPVGQHNDGVSRLGLKFYHFGVECPYYPYRHGF